MAVSRIAHVAFPGTSSAVNTTGATLFFVTLSNISSAATISDSAGNTWVGTNTVTSGARVTKGYYVIGPTTSASHTFTIGNANFSDGAFVALDPTSPVFDTQNAGSTSGTTTLNPGSLTPGGATNLIIATLGGDANTSIAIGSSFNIGESAVNTPYGAQGVATAWLEQASATAQNPTWTVGANGNSICSNLVSFTFTGGGGGLTAAQEAGIFSQQNAGGIIGQAWVAAAVLAEMVRRRRRDAWIRQQHRRVHGRLA